MRYPNVVQIRAHPRGQCRLNVDNAVKARENVRKRAAHFLRLPLSFSCQALDAEHALPKKIITRARDIRRVLSKACN